MADPLWSNVAALLHFDGGITDARGHAVTFDHASIVTPAIAGSGSCRLNGGQIVIPLDFHIGLLDFSVEVLVNVDGDMGIEESLFSGTATGGGISADVVFDDPDITVEFWALSALVGSASFQPNVTTKLELSRHDGVFYAMVDGQVVGSLAESGDLDFSSFYIGRGQGSSYGDPEDLVFSGKIDEFRLTVGAYRNIANYTPDYGVLPGAPAATATVFSVRVVVNSVDVTDLVVGDLVIEAEEGSARVVDVLLKPAPGTEIAIADWTGKPVIVSFGDFSTGVLLDETVLFTGKVDLPTVDLIKKTLMLRCTDDLQGVVRAMTAAAVDSLVGGYYSAAVFNQSASVWGYLNDRVSTRTASVDISPAGEIRITNWAAKAFPDISFYGDDVIENSLSVDFANRASMVNHVDVEFSYRFPRMKSEGHVCAYDILDGIAYGWGGYVNQNLAVPTREMVVSAIESSGGVIESITWDALPTSSVIIYGPGGVPAGFWIPNPATDPFLCTGWSAEVSFHYAQETEEKHNITIINQVSINEIGVVKERMSGAIDGEYADINAAETTVTLYQNAITGIPPADKAPVISGITNSVDVTMSSNSNRAAADSAMETLISIGKTRIASAHRLNTVSASVILPNSIDLDKTIAVYAGGVEAKGKVRRLVHEISPNSGRAITSFDLAISSIAGVGITHQDDAVASPDGTTPGTSSEIVEPEIVFNNGITEDHSLTITFPGVDEIERARAEHVIATSVNAAIPEDVFRVAI